MLMNPRSVGGFDMDAVEESWISTIGVTTQVATRRDWRGVSSSVAVSCVDIADAFPETVVLDQCGHNRAHLPPTGHCTVQFEQCGDAVWSHVFRLRRDGVHSQHRV